jgi:hypothetical protein
MTSVLHLDPVVAPTWPVAALAMLRDQTLQPHPTRRFKQLGADLALLEGRSEDSLGPPAQKLSQVGFSQMQRQPAQVVPP